MPVKSVATVTMVHRFRGPAPREIGERERVAAPEDQYWSPVIDAFLMRGRLARRLTEPMVLHAESEVLKTLQHERKARSLVVEATDAGAWPVSPNGLQSAQTEDPSASAGDQWVWLAWLTLRLSVDEADGHDNALAQVQSFLSEYHVWAPSYPGAPVPVLASDDAAGGTILSILAECLPPTAQYLTASLKDGIFDQRFGVWALVDSGVFPPDDGTLRALIDIDPPSGMDAPAAWRNDWLSVRTYRRWPEVVYGFTHHSGLVIHGGVPWIEGLCRPRFPLEGARGEGCYFDMALLVFGECALEAEVRRMRTASDLGFAQGASIEIAEGTLRALDEALWSPVDQGRALAALWRRVARSDLGFPEECRW